MFHCLGHSLIVIFDAVQYHDKLMLLSEIVLRTARNDDFPEKWFKPDNWTKLDS